MDGRDERGRIRWNDNGGERTIFRIDRRWWCGSFALKQKEGTSQKWNCRSGGNKF